MLVELFAPRESIVLVKSLIVTPGLFVLVPAIAVTGGTGFYAFQNKSRESDTMGFI
jgi:hypothetical protein